MGRDETNGSEFQDEKDATMNAPALLLICGLLQVTVVAAVGLVASGVCRRCLRASAGTPLIATLASVVLLTLLAVSPWPSWLETESGQELAGDSTEVTVSDTVGTAIPVRRFEAPTESFGIREALAAGEFLDE